MESERVAGNYTSIHPYTPLKLPQLSTFGVRKNEISESLW
jgi:hypothetical protein